MRLNRFEGKTPDSNLGVIALGAVLVAVVLILWERHAGPRPVEPSSPVSPQGRGWIDQKTLAKVLALENQDKTWDEKLWGPAIEAEKFEEIIVQFWDELRSAGEPASIFKKLEFDQLYLGSMTNRVPRENGIEERVPASPRRALRVAEWQSWIDDLERRGYRLDGSEWRMRDFSAEGEMVRARVAAWLDLRGPGLTERTTVKGDIQLTWRRQSNQVSLVEIDGSRLKLLSRSGPPVWRKVVEEVLPENDGGFNDPLIVADLNDDGRPEIILACQNVVYWHQANGVFEKRQLCSRKRERACACTVGDFTGDGYVDLLFAGPDTLEVFPGNAQGVFSAPRASWKSPEPLLNPFVMAAGDIDADGDLDVWLAQYKLPYVEGQMPTPYYDANDGFPSYLLVNDGAGRFSDRTAEAGLAPKRFRRTYSASFADLNDDGKLDLLVVSDFAGGDLYLNGGGGHFRDATDHYLKDPRLFGMAHAFADFNLDGALDIFLTGMNSYVAERLDRLNLNRPDFAGDPAMRSKMGYGNRIYLRDQSGFKPAPFNDDVAATGWSWGTIAADFDNDGDGDIYIANGHQSRSSAADYENQFWRFDIYAASSKHDPVLDLYFQTTATRRSGCGQSYGGHQSNQLLLNQAGQGFLSAGYLMGVAMREDSRNVVAADLDHDGHVDLLVTTEEEWPRRRRTLQLFRNLWRDGNWIGFRFKPVAGQASPLGATVRLVSRGHQEVKVLAAGDSYRSQHPSELHFGLGSVDQVEKLEIRWPNGAIQHFKPAGINRYWNVVRETR